MAMCPVCRLEMLRAEKCTHKYIKINGKFYERNTTYYDINKRCHDCNIVNTLGNVHHFGCDVEKCPACNKQLISCDCELIEEEDSFSMKEVDCENTKLSKP